MVVALTTTLVHVCKHTGVPTYSPSKNRFRALRSLAGTISERTVVLRSAEDFLQLCPVCLTKVFPLLLALSRTDEVTPHHSSPVQHQGHVLSLQVDEDRFLRLTRKHGDAVRQLIRKKILSSRAVLEAAVYRMAGTQPHERPAMICSSLIKQHFWASRNATP